jgi:hypothetical protein
MPVVIYDFSVCYKNITINDIEQIINIFYTEFKIVSLIAPWERTLRIHNVCWAQKNRRPAKKWADRRMVFSSLNYPLRENFGAMVS